MFNDWISTPGSFSDNAIETMGTVSCILVSVPDFRMPRTDFAIGRNRSSTSYQALSIPKIPWRRAGSSRQYGLEAAWQRGPYWIMAEYLRTDVDAPVCEYRSESTQFVPIQTKSGGGSFPRENSPQQRIPCRVPGGCKIRQELWPLYPLASVVVTKG